MISAAFLNAYKFPKKYSPSLILGLSVAGRDHLLAMSDAAINRSNEIVKEIKCGSSNENIIENFDTISNELCKIADWCECVRNIFPFPTIAAAAAHAHTKLVNFVEELNSDYILYQKLKKFIKKNEFKLKEEEITIAHSLIADFENSGIHLNCRLKDLFEAKNNIAKDSEQFLTNCQSNLDRTCINHSQIILLNSILTSRKKMAKILAFNSFSEYNLKMTMAGSYENVFNFLHRIISITAQSNQIDFSAISQILPMRIESLKELASLAENSTINDPVILPLDNLINTLLEILENLFGVSLHICKDAPEYVWSSAIVRIIVKDKGLNKIGSFYCDLFQRAHKPFFSCHYTLLGRKSDQDTQLPSVYLSLNIPIVYKDTKLYTSFCGAETFFHEMGHCLHSIMYNGKYQHLSGTRCSTDLAEIPSLLFEQFLYDPYIVKRLFPSFNDKKITEFLDNKFNDRYSRILKTAIDSLVDLTLHSSSDEKAIDCIRIVDHLMNELPLASNYNNMIYYQYFNHLIQYPAKYYSYLWSEGCARMIWKNLFENNALNSEAGNLFLENFLRKGASQSGFELMRSTLNKSVDTDDIVNNLIN